MDLKQLLGEDLYNQVVEQAGDEKVAVVSDGSYIPKAKFDGVNDELKQYKQQVSDRDEQLEDLKKKAGNNEDMQATIDQLKEDNKKEQDRLKAELNQQKFDYEMDRALREHASKNPRAVKGLLDTENIKLNKDGELEGLDEQVAKLKETDDYLFNIEDETEPEDNKGQGQNQHTRTNYHAGQSQKTNRNANPKNSRDAGKERALKRHGLLNNDNPNEEE